MAWTFFIGFNAAFWCLVGFVRLLAETRIGQAFTRKCVTFSLYIRTAMHDEPREKPIAHKGIAIIAATIGVILFTFTNAFIADLYIYQYPFHIQALIIGVMWAAGASLTGYLAGNGVMDGHMRTARIAGFFFSAGQTVVTLAFAGDSHVLTMNLSIPTILLIAALHMIGMLSAVSGGFVSRVLFVMRRAKKTSAQTYELAHALQRHRILPHEVASITPAHNEEMTIGRTLASLKRILPTKNIYVASDASTDRTVSIVKSAGAQVLDIWPNKGKANALVHAISTFKLLDRYKAVIIVDADSELEEHYLERALPLFDDPDIGAVAVHALSKWRPHNFPRRHLLYTAYRVRFYRLLQAMFRYGQTWRGMSMTNIIPGFASIYRTDVLKSIEINAPGLVIEDFNMTFEVHRKKLGKIAYLPSVIAASQDPLTLKDYSKQVRRWSLGFWQTVRRHGIWPSMFWVSLGSFIVELIAVNILMVLTPVFIVLLVFGFGPVMIPLPFPPFAIPLTLPALLLGLIVSDVLATIIVAIYERKPVLMLYAPAFIFIRYLDSLIFFYAFFLSLYTKSTGVWTSPKRQNV